MYPLYCLFKLEHRHILNLVYLLSKSRDALSTSDILSQYHALKHHTLLARLKDLQDLKILMHDTEPQRGSIHYFWKVTPNGRKLGKTLDDIFNHLRCPECSMIGLKKVNLFDKSQLVGYQCGNCGYLKEGFVI